MTTTSTARRIRPAFITGLGAFLPGDPIDNDHQAELLGYHRLESAAVRSRVRALAANGIRSRHYALDADGAVTHLNEQLAAEAARRALADRGLTPNDVGMLATGTTVPDLLVPGFASMVHGELGGAGTELLSSSGVCASSLAALQAVVRAIRCGDQHAGLVTGSELAGRMMRAAAAGPAPAAADTDFLRWTLSDGAGAAVVESTPRPDGIGLRVDWIRLTSDADTQPACMTFGAAPTVAPSPGATWLDAGGAYGIADPDLVRLRQDMRRLPALLDGGVAEFARLAKDGLLDPDGLEHVLCHYSAAHFAERIFTAAERTGLPIHRERWFSNLETCGNTGSASIWVALEEAWRTGRFAVGDRVLLVVPESGRFTYGFAHLTCVGPDGARTGRRTDHDVVARDATLIVAGSNESPPVPSPLATAADAATADSMPEPVQWALEALGDVWAELERDLAGVPMMARLNAGTLTRPEYLRLLFDLRQQVVDGSRWIARAASSFSMDNFELRSAMIRHAEEEHRDYQLIERDYAALGGDVDALRRGQQNIGSEALSAFMFHRAAMDDPVDLLGAMFVIEGLGSTASRWAEQLKRSLDLTDDQVRFLGYHGTEDVEHLDLLRAALCSPSIDRAAAERIVRTARIVARLYVLQLEEIERV